MRRISPFIAIIHTDIVYIEQWKKGDNTLLRNYRIDAPSGSEEVEERKMFLTAVEGTVKERKECEGIVSRRAYGQ